jgi:hypothetical protein
VYMTSKQREMGGVQDIWKITPSEAESVRSPRKIALQLAAGDTPLAALKRVLGDDSILAPMRTRPNEYHARMIRPILFPALPFLSHVNEPTILDIAAKSLGSLASLVERLQSICRVVHPEAASSTYGHEIRNLLILACTEVVASWRGILEANGIVKGRMDTNDYVKLNDVMKLADYSLSLPYFPWLPSFQPFLGWRVDCPTQSLKWYDAYNAVKHDREGNFDRATLQHAMEAVCACFVMIHAQFGYGVTSRGAGHDVQKFFLLTGQPSWAFEDYYFNTTPMTVDAVWNHKNYF